MKVDIIRMHLFDGAGKKKAAADITIGGIITIYGCAVVEGKEGALFIGMPQRKDPKQEGKYWSIVKIEKDEVYAEVSKKVIEEYFKKVAPQTDAPMTPDEIAWEE